MMETIGNNIVKPFGCTKESKKRRSLPSDRARQQGGHPRVMRTSRRGAGWRGEGAQ
jgi:hypothetical protein